MAVGGHEDNNSWNLFNSFHFVLTSMFEPLKVGGNIGPSWWWWIKILVWGDCTIARNDCTSVRLHDCTMIGAVWVKQTNDPYIWWGDFLVGLLKLLLGHIMFVLRRWQLAVAKGDRGLLFRTYFCMKLFYDKGGHPDSKIRHCWSLFWQHILADGYLIGMFLQYWP